MTSKGGRFTVVASSSPVARFRDRRAEIFSQVLLRDATLFYAISVEALRERGAQASKIYIYMSYFPSYLCVTI